MPKSDTIISLLKSGLSRVFVAMATKTSKPILSFGVITDVQYADIPDSFNFTKTAVRYYRGSLDLLRKAVDSWNRDANAVSFVAQLGDIIDGKNSSMGSKEVAECALNTVLDALKQFSGSVHHVWGNHELYNFGKDELLSSGLYSGPTGARIPYYDFSPCEGFRFAVLDNYDISVLGSKANSADFVRAWQIIKTKNNNRDMNSDRGLVGSDKRFVAFNGAMSTHQLQWLDGVLSGASLQGEKVILLGHVPVYEPANDPMCLQWNYDELLDVIHKHDCVVAYFAGHTHCGSYVTDDHGVHHITMDCVIETSPDSSAFATVDVYADRLVLRGFGRVPSMQLLFPS